MKLQGSLAAVATQVEIDPYRHHPVSGPTLTTGYPK